MTATTTAAPTSPSETEEDAGSLSTILWDGFMAGAVGALIVALWFLVRDTMAGHPLHTPSLFATVLLEGPAAAAEGVEFHSGPVAIYSLVHMGLFWLLGTGLFLAARKLAGGARTAAVAVSFLVLLGGIYAFSAAVWPPVAADLPLWSVLAANGLAGAGMAYYLKLRTGRIF